MKKYHLLLKCCYTIFFLSSFIHRAETQVDVTFHVDMQNEVVASSGVHLAGTFSNWMLIPMNNDGDGTWSLSRSIPSGINIQYRFYNGDTANDAEDGTNLSTCGEPTASNDFDRTFFIQTTTIDIPLVCFASCDACPREVDACIGDPLRICVDIQENISSDPLSYQWFDAADNPVTSVSANPCYDIQQISLSSPLFFYCTVSDNSGAAFPRQDFTLKLLEQDAIGGKYFPNQFIIKFSPTASQSYRDQLRADFQAELLDNCMCTMELWEIPDNVEYPPGSGNFLIEDEDKKNLAEDDPKIEEVDFNYQTSEEPLLSDNSNIGSSTHPPDELAPCAALFFNENETVPFDDYVEINPDPSNVIAANNFTIEAWIKGNASEQVAHHPLILSNRQTTSQGFMFFLATSGSGFRKLTLQLNSINYINPNTPDVLDGVCHHIAITKNNNQLLYYIDGLLNYTRTIPSNLSIASSHPLWMGKDPISLTTTPFRGLIEEVRIWDVARTTEQILQTAKYTLKGNEPNLLAYWDIKDENSQVLFDKTNNGFDGVLGGTLSPENTDPIWVNDCCYKKPVLTAIIDGGMQYDHPDLINKIWDNAAENPDNMDEDGNCAIDDIIGYSYAEDDNDPYDGIIGHGTHVGGLAIKTAEGNFGNTTNVLNILNLKVFDDDNKGNLFDAACAILHAADKKAKVINCSWGYYGLPTGILTSALEVAGQDCGALVITSAGNRYYNVFDSLHYPGNHNEVFNNMLQVASVDTIRDDQYETECFALYFDGVDDLVEIADPYIGNTLNTHDFTMEAWIKAGDNQADNPLIFSNYTQTEGFRFFFLDASGTFSSKILAIEMAGTVYAATDTPYAFDNNCHHIAAVRSNNQLFLYMDGNLIESFDIIGNPNLDSNSPLWFGKDPISPTNYIYQGLMEEARFWNIALTPAQIQNNAQNQINSNATNLIAHYKFNEFGQQEVMDAASEKTGFLGRMEEPETTDPQWLNDCCVTDYTLISSTLNTQLAPYSNYSEDLVDIATWGLNYSTMPLDDMGWKIGTSMSSGLITGVAARLFYENPAAQWSDVKQCILDNASNLVELNGFVNQERFFDPDIDLDNAIECIRGIVPNPTGICETILPLEFLSFKGQQLEQEVQLKWEIISSTPILKFEVERLNQQSQWTTISTLVALTDSKQNQFYKTLDKNPYWGENFYRLNIIYDDGKTEKSDIVLVDMGDKDNTWNIYPNPANDVIQIEGLKQINENTILYLYNYTGIELKHVSLAKNTHTTDLQIEDLANGLYILVIKEGQKTLMQKRFVKMGH